MKVIQTGMAFCFYAPSESLFLRIQLFVTDDSIACVIKCLPADGERRRYGCYL